MGRTAADLISQLEGGAFGLKLSVSQAVLDFVSIFEDVSVLERFDVTVSALLWRFSHDKATVEVGYSRSISLCTMAFVFDVIFSFLISEQRLFSEHSAAGYESISDGIIFYFEYILH